MSKAPKSIETRHYEERDAFFAGLRHVSRRSFVKLAGLSAGLAMAKGLVTPHGFQLVQVASAAEGERPSFTFAYVSDTHLYPPSLNDRFVRAALKAVDDVNALDPQPDFVLFGGDLARKAASTVRAGDVKQVDELAIQSHFSELGRFLVTKQANDIGAFKTPGLRNVAVTAPYMHDGSLATLWDVMDHYNKGGVPNPNLDGGMQRLGLTEAEIDDLVAFMESLTSSKFAALAKQEMARQRARKSVRPERETAVAMGKQGHLGDLAPTPDPARPAAFGVLVRGGTSYE